MFGQQHYPQHLGNSTTVTIAEEGCLLTAVCNGLEKFNGSAPDPVTLNYFFSSHGVFTYDAIDRAADDLSWDSISKFDPSVTVAQIGNGSLPPSNNAMVKFHYNSVHTGNPIFHFCWVDHVEGDRLFIIDSWDGLVKPPEGYEGVYHKPIAWATYNKAAPVLPPPPPPPPVPVPEPAPYVPPSAPLPIPTPTQPYTLIRSVLAYDSANDAVNDRNAKGSVPAGSYFVFNQRYGMLNLTSTLGRAGDLVNSKGGWINPKDNQLDPEPPKPVLVPWPEPVVTPTPPPISTTPANETVSVTVTPSPNWHQSYAPYRDKFGNVAPILYEVLRDAMAVDSERGGTKQVQEFDEYYISGEFTGPDGVHYARPEQAAHAYRWWGIPFVDPVTGLQILKDDNVYNTKTTPVERRVLHTENTLDRVSISLGKIDKQITKVWDIIRPKLGKK